MNWGSAFLSQARSDFAGAEALLAHGGQHSQATMLLQMAWEKLGKSALDRSGQFDPDQKSHSVASRLISVLQRGAASNANIIAMAPQGYHSWLQRLKRELRDLEKLCPAVAGSAENAEYPWLQRDQSGHEWVHWPAEHLTRAFTSPECRLWRDFSRLADNLPKLAI